MHHILLGAALLVLILALTGGQVVFRPHFLYKQRQQEKAEKENKRRQEILELAAAETQAENNDPYYYNYYAYQPQPQPDNLLNFYQAQRYQLSPLTNRVARSLVASKPLNFHRLAPE